VKRREFMALLGSAMAARPLAARAQQPDRMRRIGVLMSTAADHPEGRARIAKFLGGLKQLGWTAGRSAQIDIRWPTGAAEARKYVAEFAAVAPDVILATVLLSPDFIPWTGFVTATTGNPNYANVPMVLVSVADPVGAGLFFSLVPGANATDISFSGLSGKWLEVLREIAPGVTRVAVLRDAAHLAGTSQWGAIQSVAPSFGMELTPIGVRDPGEIARGVAEFARRPNGGLIVTAGGPVIVHREHIIAAAATHSPLWLT